MINTDRIVPITTVDLISMYGLILLQDSDNSAMTALQATDAGVFAISSTGIKLAAEPVKACNITAASATLYFVAAYDYEGFTVNGSAATIADNDVEVIPDARTLYKAVLATGTITITKVGF